MRSRTLKLSVASCIAVLGAAAVLIHPSTALATPASAGFVSKVLAMSFFERIQAHTAPTADEEQADADGQAFNEVKILAQDRSDVYVVRNTVAPGANSGWHTHPGPSVVLVKSGIASVYDGNDPSCKPVNYAAGSGFIDAGGTHIHLIRNGGAEPLVTLVFQIVPAGAARRITVPHPGYCASF